MLVVGLRPQELKALVIETERAWQALGTVSYGPSPKERDSLKFRRSLYIARDMQKGDELTPDTLRIVRPGFGLLPKYYELLLGRKITRDVRKGTAVTWELVLAANDKEIS